MEDEQRGEECIALRPAGGGMALSWMAFCDRERSATGISAASGDGDMLSGHLRPWFVLRVVGCSHSNAMLVTK